MDTPAYHSPTYTVARTVAGLETMPVSNGIDGESVTDIAGGGVYVGPRPENVGDVVRGEIRLRPSGVFHGQSTMRIYVYVRRES